MTFKLYIIIRNTYNYSSIYNECFTNLKVLYHTMYLDTFHVYIYASILNIIYLNMYIYIYLNNVVIT